MMDGELKAVAGTVLNCNRVVIAPAQLSGTSQVPEPTGLALAVVAAVGLLTRWGTSRR